MTATAHPRRRRHELLHLRPRRTAPRTHRSGNTVTWYHHDQLGSTRSLSSATGATAAYDPYGNLTASTGKLSPLGFAGEYTDAETGFQYLRARYYDPATGQFLSRDPLVALTGSAYGYVAGNPLNGADPSGLTWIDTTLRVAEVAGGGIAIGPQW